MLHKILSYRQAGSNIHVNCVDSPLLHGNWEGTMVPVSSLFDVTAKQERSLCLIIKALYFSKKVNLFHHSIKFFKIMLFILR